MKRDYLKDGIVGQLVGDAVGLPFQFLDRDTFECTDMVGNGTFHMPEGSFSDDGSLTLATLDSLKKCGGVNLEDIMENFCAWLYDGAFTQYGTAYDIGGGTMNSIDRYRYDGLDVYSCGGNTFLDNGNGSLMRILPLAFFDHTTEDIRNVSALTHAHEISKTACCIYLNIAEGIMSGKSKYDAVYDATKAYDEHEYFRRLSTIDKCERAEIKSSGYVVDSIEAALWCLLTTGSYRECILAAVNLGEDTDTVAAIVGGLAGLLYGIGGEKGVPEEWVQKTCNRDWVRELVGLETSTETK